MTQKENNIDALVAAADALESIAMKARNATNNAFAAGTEERDGGSGRRQGKMMDQYEDWHKELNAALTEYRAAREAVRKGTPPARECLQPYCGDVCEEDPEEDRDAYNLRVYGLREEDLP